MKGKILYFSGTGNTKFIATKIYKKLYNRNIDVTMDSIEKVESIAAESLDFLGLGFPIYADNAPMYFINWIKNNIPDTNKRIKVLIFSTSVSSGCGVEVVGRIMEKKGYEVVVKKGFNMPNNFYFHKGFKETSEEKKKFFLNKSEEEVNNIVDIFLENKTCFDKQSFARVKLAEVVSKLSDKFMKKQDKKFNVSEKCTKCRKCVENCPCNNIELDEKIEFKHKCCFCTRCIHMCPVNAIEFKGKTYNQYRIGHIK